MVVASASSKGRSLSVRIVSYNILSSHLATPTQHFQCKEEHLLASNRLPKIISKLEEEMKQTNPNNNQEEQSNVPPVIFCLQEVSQSWTGPLSTFFIRKGYHFIPGLYGKKFNNYMGVALAYPMDQFETLSIDVSRLSDYRIGGWPRPPKPEEEEEENDENMSVLNRLWKRANQWSQMTIQTLFLRPTQYLLRLTQQQRRSLDHWEISENRFNILLTASLKWRSSSSSSSSSSSTTQDTSSSTSSSFTISTYHMPCIFYKPMVMTIHSEMAIRRCQDLAMKNNNHHPYIIAGDFNIKPNSAQYQLITTGTLPPDDDNDDNNKKNGGNKKREENSEEEEDLANYPTPKYGMKWSSHINKMRSAYKEFSNKNEEPDFTNYAQTNEDGPFIETLDYIFISDEWKVDNVKELPHRNDDVIKNDGPYPNENEPSDHLLIRADLSLSSS